jgi:hypothetical protein
VLYGGDCRTWSVKGYVQREEAADADATDFIMNVPGGLVSDCTGRPFPGASLLSTYSNRCAAGSSRLSR